MKQQKNNQPKVTDNGDNKLAIGIGLGLAFGAAAGAITNNWSLVAVGLCIGVALGVSAKFSNSGKSKKEK